MRERLLGPSGIRVSELCLGTMTFGTEWDMRHAADEDTSRAMYEAFREAGGNFIDTANVYGRSEEILGRLLAHERDAVVLATKFTLDIDPEDHNSGGSHRKSLRRSLEASLRLLGTDYIDLLWVHAWDQRTPMDETLRALDDLVRAGKVLAIGVSNMPAWVVSRADAIAQLRGWSPLCALQVEYSLAARTAERELLPMARALGLAVTAWSPLARGVLVGKESPRTTPEQAEAAKVVAEVASELGTTPSRVALAWLLHHDVLPVLGVSRMEQLTDNLGAAELELDEHQLERLGAPTAVSLGYPHEFLQYMPDHLRAP